MSYDILDINFDVKCNYCGETIKGFIVFGRHTNKKQGGQSQFKELVYEKNIVNGDEVLKLFASAECPGCHLDNLYHLEYNLKTDEGKQLPVVSPASGGLR